MTHQPLTVLYDLAPGHLVQLARLLRLASSATPSAVTAADQLLDAAARLDAGEDLDLLELSRTLESASQGLVADGDAVLGLFCSIFAGSLAWRAGET